MTCRGVRPSLPIASTTHVAATGDGYLYEPAPEGDLFHIVDLEAVRRLARTSCQSSKGATRPEQEKSSEETTVGRCRRPARQPAQANVGAGTANNRNCARCSGNPDDSSRQGRPVKLPADGGLTASAAWRVEGSVCRWRGAKVLVERLAADAEFAGKSRLWYSRLGPPT